MPYRVSCFVFAALLSFGCTGDQADNAAEPSATPSQVAGQAGGEMATTGPTKLNLNKASAEEFKTIPGMTDRMVREFDEYRPYASIQQFRREIGKYVSEDIVAGYEQYVFVPVDPNNSDAETLMQIPGIDASVVEEIVALRPYESPEAFLEAIAPMLSEEHLAAVSGFLTEQ